MPGGGFELRNVVANYPFEKSRRFAAIQPNFGHGDHSRLSCGVHVVPEFALAQPYTEVPNTGQFLLVRWTNSKRQFSFEVAASSSPYTFATN